MHLSYLRIAHSPTDLVQNLSATQQYKRQPKGSAMTEALTEAAESNSWNVLRHRNPVTNTFLGMTAIWLSLLLATTDSVLALTHADTQATVKQLESKDPILRQQAAQRLVASPEYADSSELAQLTSYFLAEGQIESAIQWALRTDLRNRHFGQLLPSEGRAQAYSIVRGVIFGQLMRVHDDLPSAIATELPKAIAWDTETPIRASHNGKEIELPANFSSTRRSNQQAFNADWQRDARKLSLEAQCEEWDEENLRPQMLPMSQRLQSAEWESFERTYSDRLVVREIGSLKLKLPMAHLSPKGGPDFEKANFLHIQMALPQGTYPAKSGLREFWDNRSRVTAQVSASDYKQFLQSLMYSPTTISNAPLNDGFRRLPNRNSPPCLPAQWLFPAKDAAGVMISCTSRKSAIQHSFCDLHFGYGPSNSHVSVQFRQEHLKSWKEIKALAVRKLDSWVVK